MNCKAVWDLSNQSNSLRDSSSSRRASLATRSKSNSCRELTRLHLLSKIGQRMIRSGANWQRHQLSNLCLSMLLLSSQTLQLPQFHQFACLYFSQLKVKKCWNKTLLTCTSTTMTWSTARMVELIHTLPGLRTQFFLLPKHISLPTNKRVLPWLIKSCKLKNLLRVMRRPLRRMKMWWFRWKVTQVKTKRLSQLTHSRLSHVNRLWRSLLFFSHLKKVKTLRSRSDTQSSNWCRSSKVSAGSNRL